MYLCVCVCDREFVCASMREKGVYVCVCVLVCVCERERECVCGGCIFMFEKVCVR